MVSEIRQLQLKCLEIFDIVVKICKEHNIDYSLCGGSVVGAYLYKGFLPWDDDIDIMMTRENYNRFLSIAKDCMPKGFSISNYNNNDNYSTYNYTKIINDNTTFVQANGIITGIFLDITVYDKVPNGWMKHIDLFLYKRAMTINRGRKIGNNLKNRVRNLLLSTILSNRKRYLVFFQKTVEFIGRRTKDYSYRELFGAYYFVNMIPYNHSIFEDYSTIEFEGREVMIVNDFINYLRTRYNRSDFRETKDKQIPSHYKFVDFQLPYKEYIKLNISYYETT